MSAKCLEVDCIHLGGAVVYTKPTLHFLYTKFRVIDNMRCTDVLLATRNKENENNKLGKSLSPTNHPPRSFAECGRRSSCVSRHDTDAGYFDSTRGYTPILSYAPNEAKQCLQLG